jgi:hypothetical protein
MAGTLLDQVCTAGFNAEESDQLLFEASLSRTVGTPSPLHVVRANSFEMGRWSQYDEVRLSFVQSLSLLIWRYLCNCPRMTTVFLKE